MSDLYSAPSLPGTTSIKSATAQWVNANAVFQQILQKLDAEERKFIVLRCDELPLLLGTDEEIQTVFSGLLRMILQKRTSVPQLFLHVNCKGSQKESRPAGIRAEYLIQFNTNIAPCANWMQTNKSQMDELSTILKKYNGSLVMAEAQGCIFSLSLPGKPL